VRGRMNYNGAMGGAFVDYSVRFTLAQGCVFDLDTRNDGFVPVIVGPWPSCTSGINARIVVVSGGSFYGVRPRIRSVAW